jgi:DNA-binding transcriptional MerR regulator
VDLMSIGEFARQSRLSPKALRLYDELGLLAPARVDDSSGSRFYDARQLEQARLVAQLRQLQIPLAEIKVILGLEPAAAAERIGELWAAVEGEHSARRELAARLVDRLSGTRSVMESLHAWVGAHDARSSDLRVRVTFLASPPVTESSAPDCDFAVPLIG